MTAMAARTMGYRVRVMDPEAACPASFVVDETIVGRWDDVDAARRLATGADAVTLEIEQIGVDALSEVARIAPLRPGVEPIRIIQDRQSKKRGSRRMDFRWHLSRGAERSGVARSGCCTGRTRVFEDWARRIRWRGQARIGFDGPATEESIHAAWLSLAERPCVAEQALELDCEISVMAARNPAGEVRSYPAARNHHENQILEWSVLPAGVPAKLEARAEALAAAIIAKLSLEGLLCVELFVTKHGELLVNELAPRPHNSYHQSERGCVTSQFEQLVRTTCNLPLGDTVLITPAAIVNLLGEVWLGESGEPNFAAALAVRRAAAFV